MKSIMTVKDLILFLLLVVVSCDSNGKNSRAIGSVKVSCLMKNMADIDSAAYRYAGYYSFETQKGSPFGSISIQPKTANIVSFELNVNLGAPSYHLNTLSGELKIVKGIGLFEKSVEDYRTSLPLKFIFTDDSVSIFQQNGSAYYGLGYSTDIKNTFIRMPVPPFEDKSEESFVYSGINEELLWDIFLKIPIDSMPDFMFQTRQKRLMAKSDRVFSVNEDGNSIEFDETDGNGQRLFMNIACYPADDGEKIITVFYYGGGFDRYEVLSDQTYEYDIATGRLKAIKRSVDPYTADEFIDGSILTPEIFNMLQDCFRKKKSLVYGIDRNGYGAYFEPYQIFSETYGEDKYDEYEDLLVKAQKYHSFIRRHWDGKRFVKVKTDPTNQ